MLRHGGPGILWLLYALRLRRLAASIQARFDERLEERARIARDLHDTLLQGIFSASIHFDVANNRLPADSPAKSTVERGLELLKQVSEEGRNALRALRSPQSASDDMEVALSRLRTEFAFPDSVDYRVATLGEPRGLRPQIRDEVYLIAREAVVNAFRHSKASAIEVEVNYASRNLVIQVRDNGRGIDAQVLKTGREGHWGLASMRERAEKIGAKLDLLSRVNAGTEIRFAIPGKLSFEETPPSRFRKWFMTLYPVVGKTAGGGIDRGTTEVNETVRIGVLSVDDHVLVREGIAALINDQPDMRLVAQGSTGHEAIQRFRDHRPDVVLLDVRLPDMNGIDAMIAIRDEFPEARIIIVSSSEGDVEMQRALEGGARGYILKSMPPKDLLEAIRKVHAGKKAIPQEIAARLANHLGEEGLTTREIEILQQIAEGNRNRDIAERLFISEGTVKVHIQHIMEKLGANDRTQAITIAVRRGIIHL